MMRKSYFFSTQRILAAILTIIGYVSVSYADEITVCPTSGLAKNTTYCYNASCEDQYSTAQTIYTADELKKTAGNITSIAYKIAQIGTSFRPNMKIYMGVTKQSCFNVSGDDDTPSNPIAASSLTLVYDGTPILGTNSAGAWDEVPLTTSYYYNGSDNLVVVVCTDGVDGDLSAPYYQVFDEPNSKYRLVGRATDESSLGYSDVNITTDLQGRTNGQGVPYVPCVKFTFGNSSENSSVIIGTGTTSNSTAPYDNAAKYSIVQNLYTSAEIGGAGQITEIAYNVASASVFAPEEIDIYMGHKSGYFDGKTDYMKAADLTKVFSSTTQVLGRTTGWESLTLTKPFNYNGTDNLVVVICKKSTTKASDLKYNCTTTAASYGLFRESDQSSCADITNTSYNYSTVIQRPNIKLTKKDVSSDADTDISSLSNVVYIEDTKTNIGSDVVVSVKLKNNTQSITALSFTFVVPDGFSIKKIARGSRLLEKDESDEYLYHLENSEKEDGTYVQIYTSTGINLSGTDGEIVKITLSMDDSVVAGEYPLVVLKAEMADDTTHDNSGRIKSTLTVDDTMIGDVNTDGVLSVSDLPVMASALLGKSVSNYNAKAADLNNDGEVTISDLAQLASKLLKQ